MPRGILVLFHFLTQGRTPPSRHGRDPLPGQQLEGVTERKCERPPHPELAWEIGAPLLPILGGALCASPQWGLLRGCGPRNAVWMWMLTEPLKACLLTVRSGRRCGTPSWGYPGQALWAPLLIRPATYPPASVPGLSLLACKPTSALHPEPWALAGVRSRGAWASSCGCHAWEWGEARARQGTLQCTGHPKQQFIQSAQVDKPGLVQRWRRLRSSSGISGCTAGTGHAAGAKQHFSSRPDRIYGTGAWTWLLGHLPLPSLEITGYVEGVLFHFKVIQVRCRAHRGRPKDLGPAASPACLAPEL